MEIVFSSYLKVRLEERKIATELVRETVSSPQQVVTGKRGRQIAQSKFIEQDKEYLLRVIFTEKAGHRLVITAYKTSNIKKYWRVL
ncbi:MAG: hypothetical protein QME51_11060 [Planctomycetota bacterium]|nr:hypothetical protein [Planctomycetota bacterium]